MEWYLAKLVYRIHCDTMGTDTQFDEQIRLVEAEDPLHAFNKAQLIGQQEQDTLQGELQACIRWQFIDVTELIPLSAQLHGAEILSQIREVKDGHAFQRDVHAKARYLLSDCTEHFLRAC